MTKIKPKNTFDAAVARDLAAAGRKVAIHSMDLTDQEWLQIAGLLTMDYECNENPVSKSAAAKLLPVIQAIKREAESAEGDDGKRMPACKFTFDDETVYDGFSHGSTWNGFDNVAVTKETLCELMRRCAADNDADTLRDYASIDPMNNGLYSLGWCFATSIVADAAKHADEVAAKIGRA